MSTAEPMIAAEVDRNVRWVFTFAEKTPRVAIRQASATRLAGDVIRVDAVVANVGWMATATVQAAQTLGTAKPVRVYLELENAEVVDGESIADLGVLPGTHGGSAEPREVSWSVRAVNPQRPVGVTVVVSSEKAGTVRQTLRVSPADTNP